MKWIIIKIEMKRIYNLSFYTIYINICNALHPVLKYFSIHTAMHIVIYIHLRVWKNKMTSLLSTKENQEHQEIMKSIQIYRHSRKKSVFNNIEMQ